MVEVPGVGERPSRVVTYATLGEIIEPRAMELLELIQAEIGRSGCEKQLGAGWFTGGGSKLGSLATFAEPLFRHGTGCRHSQRFGGDGETLRDPAFATVVGLAIYGYRQRLLHDAKESNGLWGKLWSSIRGKIELSVHRAIEGAVVQWSDDPMSR